jgi:hypothetical protein
MGSLVFQQSKQTGFTQQQSGSLPTQSSETRCDRTALALVSGSQLDTTMLWNRFSMVVVSIVTHGRAIPLLWQTLERPSARVSASVSIALLEKADRLQAGFESITLRADRAFPCDQLLAWFRGRSRCNDVMRLLGDTEIQDTAAPLGCQVRRLHLHRGACRGFRGVRLWADGNQTVNMVLAHPTGLPVEEPWYLISNAEPSLDLVWNYTQRFCCEQLFRDLKSGVFQLESTGLREPEWINRLLMMVAIDVLAGSLRDYALSLHGLRRHLDPHWKRSISSLHMGLAALQMEVADVTARLMAAYRSPSRNWGPASRAVRPGKSKRRPSSQRLNCHRERNQQPMTHRSWLSHESHGRNISGSQGGGESTSRAVLISRASGAVRRAEGR